MREYGIPKVLTWRWAPFAALVLGALSFVAFTLLAIPDRIGHVQGETTSDRFSLGSHFTRASVGATPASDWSKDNAEPSVAPPSPVTRVATQATDNNFPRRGFSPPLERAEPVSPPAPPPQPVLAVPPPVPAPPPPEVMPQPVPAPGAAEAPPPPPPVDPSQQSPAVPPAN